MKQNARRGFIKSFTATSVALGLGVASTPSKAFSLPRKKTQTLM